VENLAAIMEVKLWVGVSAKSPNSDADDRKSKRASIRHEARFVHSSYEAIPES
jgi:hypothetical protein